MIEILVWIKSLGIVCFPFIKMFSLWVCYQLGIGYLALGGALNTDGAIAIGHSALGALTTGVGNIAIGKEAGDAITTGARNIAIGESAFSTSINSSADNIAIGYNAMNGSGTTAASEKNIAIGNYTMNGNQNDSDHNIAVGYQALNGLTTGDGNVVIGGAAGYTAQDVDNLVLIGKDAGTVINHVNSDGTIAIGASAALALTSADQCIYIGFEAGKENTTGGNNTVIGHQAMNETGAVPGSEHNTFIGVAAGGGDWITAVSDLNVGVGNFVMDAVMNGATGNVSMGYSSLTALTEGDHNVAVGRNAGATITTGDENVAVGYSAMNGGTVVGDHNIAIGAESGDALTSGTRNIFVGAGSGGSVAGAADCIAIGHLALNQADDGYNDACIAIGSYALRLQNANVYAKNMAIGHNAMSASVQMTNTVAIGYDAGGGNTDGDYNTIVGNFAMASPEANRNPSHNVAIGYAAGRFMSLNGDGNNTIVGDEAASGLGFTGTHNTILGTKAGATLSTGIGNTLIGYGSGLAGTDLTTGDYNVHVGYWNGPNAADGNYRFSIGYNIDHTADNRFMVGVSGNYFYADLASGGATQITSDRRRKRNITDDKLGLQFINLLKTKTFQWRPAEEHPPEWKPWFEDPDTGEITYDEMDTETVMHGLIAQDVKEAMDEVECDTFGGWDEDVYGRQHVAREMFVIPLIKAVQELSTKVEEQAKRIEELEG